MKILFVCTGNTCRSPMAQVMAAKLWGADYEVISAGLMAMPSSPASNHAVSAMKNRQLDLSSHRAQMVTDKLIEEAELILTMTESHKEALVQVAKDKVYTLGEYAGQRISISDPYGGDLRIYNKCADEIYSLLIKITPPVKGAVEENLKNLHVTTHPLVESKLTLLRDKNIGNKEFRELVREIAMFMCYEATRDATLKEIEVETPVCKAKAKISDRKYAIVPILRAGLGMVDGVSDLLPTAKIGHIGLFRDPESLKPIEYYFKMPPDSAEREVLLLDPMVGTGGTAVAAIDFLKQSGVKQIKLLSLLVSPEGIRVLQNTHPDVQVYTAALDECLNSHGYIVPGLGDAGDRLFGTK